MNTPTALVQKLWNYCNILRDDGLYYGDYVEQLTFLLFLKMADEQARSVAEVERLFSVVEELESVVSAKLQRATLLRQSILQKGFAGELV
jgi:type I restriction-modification system DNA methylase subunit